MKSFIVLISNPAAKGASGKKIARASYYLQAKGFQVDVLFTGKKGDAEELARDAIKQAPALIVAAGGDGTFNEVANGIAGSGIPMAILPLGTSNVLAKELRIPEDVEGALEVVVNGAVRLVSLGKIDINRHSFPLSRYFILMAGIGFDGEAVLRVSGMVKKISGKGSYIYSGIKTLLHHDTPELTLTIDGRTYSGYSAIIGNAAKYGGNFSITPDAKVTDPVLYACLFKGKRRLDYLRYVYGVVTGSLLTYADVQYLKANRVEITGKAHIQIDGDYFGMTPANITVVPDALRLIF
jgi:YegS/Rv2252/BmrU family lipid kinase